MSIKYIKTGGSFPEDSILVRATMLWPDDRERWRHYCAVDYANRFVHEDDSPEICQWPASLIRSLLEAPSRSQVKRDTAQATKRGIIAGYIFVFMYLMDLRRDRLPDRGAKGASLSKAKFLAQKKAQSGTSYGDGTKLFTSDTTIEQCWQDYRSVAHLWAAGLMNKFVPYAGRRLTDPVHFPRFLQTAAFMQQFGTTHKLDNRSKTSPETLLVAANTWLIDLQEYPPKLLLPKVLSVLDRHLAPLTEYKA